jgi:hypothetical protein
MADIDASRLPSVAGAKELQEARRALNTTQKQTAQHTTEPGAQREQREADNARGARDQEGRTVEGAARAAADGAGHAAKGAARTIAGAAGIAKPIADVAGGIASAFENLLGGAKDPPPPPSARQRAAADERAAEADRQALNDARVKQANDDMTKMRQALVQEFERDLENEPDADLERGRQRRRERDRDRDGSR